MNSTRSFKSFLALPVLAACLSAACQGAQPVCKGRLTLPFETRWGTVVLPAGNYSFAMHSATDSNLVNVVGEHARALIMNPVDIRKGEPSAASHLLVARQGGKGTVRALYLKPLGVTLYYPAPKGEGQVLAQASQLTDRIPVSTAGE